METNLIYLHQETSKGFNMFFPLQKEVNKTMPISLQKPQASQHQEKANHPWLVGSTLFKKSKEQEQKHRHMKSDIQLMPEVRHPTNV